MSEENITIEDVLGLSAGHAKRPDHPDFYRLAEISLEMRAEMAEANGDIEKQFEIWKTRITKSIDFETLNYHAMQIALQIFNLNTIENLQALKRDPGAYEAFVAVIQTYYDGFLMGSEFAKRKG